MNTEGVHIDSVKKAFKQLGFEVLEEDIPHIIGHGYEVYKHYFHKKWDYNFDEYRAIQKEIYLENLDNAEIFTHTTDLIKRLHAKNVPIAVTTSASRENTLLVLEKAGVGGLFEVIVSKEDCKNLKPHPEPYLLTAEKLGIDPKFCVVIEDTRLGVQSAKAAGMMCIAIPNEYTKDQDFAIADAVVESGKNVEAILEFIE
jgi:HAD superfamily hydrolase (TIGR01509 family)